MPTVLLILFLSYVLFMFLGGYLGFIKAEPFKFSDKVDLFYIEPRSGKPRKQVPVSSSRHVRVRPNNGQSRAGSQRKLLRTPVSAKSFPVRREVCPKADSRRKRPVANLPSQSIDGNVFAECVAALKQLGYGSNVHCKHVVSKHINSLPFKLASCEAFLESFLKLESCNESKLRSSG